MQLNSAAGTKYGIPFPVFARLTFGPSGAHIPAVSRGLVACGWNAVQCWIGGAAIAAIIGVFAGGFLQMEPISFIGADNIDPARLIGFFVFLLIILFFSTRGSEGLKKMQAIAAPLLALLTVALLIWSTQLVLAEGYTIGDVMTAGSDYTIMARHGGQAMVFMLGLTASIAFWATLALNISDFSRYAVSQKAQFRGQLYGLPLSMFFCSFVGAYFAQATLLALGTRFFDPSLVLMNPDFIDSGIIIFIAAVSLAIITITTTIVANVVAPANVFSNLVPTKISYNTGVLLTCILTIVFRPWWIMGGPGAFITAWLGTYGSILAPIAAIFIADYWFVKRRTVDVMGLFKGSDGRYWYQGGVNVRAIVAWFVAVILPLIDRMTTSQWSAADPVFTPGVFGGWLTANGYIFAFIVGLIVYVLLMKSEKTSQVSDEEHAAMTQRA
jgi:NCS1 family nucleobase:cation symporter-1